MGASAAEDLLQSIGALLEAQPDVTVALLFGSAASGRLRPDSDLDVAVLAGVPLTATRRRELIELLALEYGRPVDLVDLHTAGPVIRKVVLDTGKRVLCRDRNAYATLLLRTLLDAADFLPYRERILRERRLAWTG